MAYHIIWKNTDGSLKITSMQNTATAEDAAEHKDTLITHGELAVFQTIIKSEQLPQERYFRNAWRFDGSNVVLDIPSCRQRHLDKLRRIRNGKLQDSDADYMRALEQNDVAKLETLKSYRQALRDMPQTASATLQTANTPSEIKAVHPAILTTLKP